MDGVDMNNIDIGGFAPEEGGSGPGPGMGGFGSTMSGLVSGMGGFGSSNPNQYDPTQNIQKNGVFLDRVEQFGENQTPAPSYREMLEKVIYDPFYIYTSTYELIALTIHPELVEKEDTESILSVVFSIFFRNYFKLIMIMLFSFQMVVYSIIIKNERLRLILLSLIGLVTFTLFLLVYPEKQVKFILLAVFLFFIVGTITYGTYGSFLDKVKNGEIDAALENDKNESLYSIFKKTTGVGKKI